MEGLLLTFLIKLNFLRFYAATKHAVTALIEGWRQSVRELNTQIRISGLSPGITFK